MFLKRLNLLRVGNVQNVYVDGGDDMNRELYYAAVNIVDYLALHKTDYKHWIYLIECLEHLENIGEIDIEAFADANDCGEYLKRNNIEKVTWKDIVEAFKELFEKGERGEIYKDLKRFKIGQEYESVCWFSGGIGYYTVKAKDNDSVTFSIGRHELDGNHECKDETYKLKYDDDGNEYITLYEYHGKENNIWAGYDGYGNEVY